MQTDNIFDIQCNNALYKRIHHLHTLAAKIAIIASLGWALLDYFVRFEVKEVVWFDLSFVVAGLVSLWVLKSPKGKRKSKMVGFFYVLFMTSVCAYFYNTLEYSEFTKFNMNYVAVFVGVGMFLMWDLKFSILIVAVNMVLNLCFYFYLSPLSIQEYFNGGGILVLTMAVFMIIAIQLRYQLILNEIKSSLMLQHSEEKANQLITTANDGVITIDEQMNVILFNPAAEEIFGFESEEIMGKSLTHLMPSSKIEEYTSKQFLNNQLANMPYENEADNQIFGKRADGSIFPMDLSISRMQFNGRFYTTSIIRDVTSESKIKQDLIAAKKLAEESKELQGRFLSNMSHEIRTPMNGVIGISRLLGATKLNDHQNRLLNTIQSSAENLLVIINDILDFSKIEAGKMSIEKIEFDLDERLRVVEEIMRIRAEDKGIKLKFNVEENIPKQLIGDPIRLNQVLLNLVGNALKFTEEGSVQVNVSMEQRGDKDGVYRFSVLDTGIGIDSNKLSSIFSSFTQAKASTTRNYGGTGLGLAITKQLIELQDGRIWVESEAGEGSIFSFELNYRIQEIEEQSFTEDVEQESAAA